MWAQLELSIRPKLLALLKFGYTRVHGSTQQPVPVPKSVHPHIPHRAAATLSIVMTQKTPPAPKRRYYQNNATPLALHPASTQSYDTATPSRGSITVYSAFDCVRVMATPALRPHLHGCVRVWLCVCVCVTPTYDMLARLNATHRERLSLRIYRIHRRAFAGFQVRLSSVVRETRVHGRVFGIASGTRTLACVAGTRHSVRPCGCRT